MNKCPICESKKFEVMELSCSECKMIYGGSFHMPPIARLGGEDVIIASKLILHGGNLKTMAEDMGITYPTLRKRVDSLMASFKELCDEDDNKISTILDDMEIEKINAKEGVRKIKDIKGET